MKIDIPIGKALYRITSDAQNIVLNEVKVTKEGENAGKEYLSPEGYFPTVTMALEGILDRSIRGSEAVTIGELLEEVRSIRQQLADVLDGI